MIRSTCERFHELAPELALGILPGAERATAIAHAQHCAACRDHLIPLAVLGDDLLGLVPSLEPSTGFETRVLNRVRPAAAPRRRTGVLTAAAVSIAVVAGFGGSAVEAALQHDHAARATVQDLRTGTFTVGGHQMGQIFLYTGKPAWVYMTVETNHPTNEITCRVVRTDGTVVDIGKFPVGDGYGHWGAPLGIDPASAAEAQLVASDGAILATSRLRA